MEGCDSVNRFNHTSRVAVVTATDCTKSVHNRRVIEVVCGVFVLSLCFLEFYVCKDFCQRIESDVYCSILSKMFLYIFLFLSVRIRLDFHVK